MTFLACEVFPVNCKRPEQWENYLPLLYQLKTPLTFSHVLLLPLQPLGIEIMR